MKQGLGRDDLGAQRRESALGNELAAWAPALQELGLSEHGAALDHLGPAMAAAWLRAHVPALEGAARLIDVVQAVGRREFPEGTERTLASARSAVVAAHVAQREDAAFAAQEAHDRELLCTWYAGPDTRLGDRPGTEGSTRAEDELLRRAVRLSFEDSGAETESATPEAVELLGEYAPDGRPRTAALATTLAAASDAHRLAGPVLRDPARRSGVVQVLCSGKPTIQRLLETAARLRAKCADWETFTDCPDLAPAAFGLRASSLRKCATWLRAHLDPLDEIASLIRAVARATSPSDGGTDQLSLDGARSSVAAVVAARAAEEDFLSSDADHRRLLGGLYEGIRTSQEAIHSALDWSLSARRTASGTGLSAAPLRPEAARLLLHAVPDSAVGRRNRDWLERTEVLSGHFTPTRAAEIRTELESTFPSANAVLDRMSRDPYGPDAWFRSAEAHETLSSYGLDELPAQLADREVPAALFPAAMERAVLRAWIEHQPATDSRLAVVRSTDHDRLVERYRRLDRGLVQAARGTVTAACNARRPRRATSGQAAILSRQSKLQRRHEPVRRLRDETPDVVQRLKPCFMMSPLTASQFLPPDYRFDVVIFDEASQVFPQDTVNAWRLGHASRNVQTSARDVLAQRRRTKQAVDPGTFWDLPGQDMTAARAPSRGFDRKVSQVPPVERQIALLGILSESPSMHREELARETARFFGWSRLGPEIRATLGKDIEALLAKKAVEEGASGLVPSENPELGQMEFDRSRHEVRTEIPSA